MKRILLLLATAALAACNLDVAQPGDHPTDPATESFDASLLVDIPTMTKTANGVYYKELTVGTGAQLTGTPSVTFTYAGFVKSGASFGAGAQATPVSLTSLVGGLQEGMQGMRVGGLRLIVIPSALGYGSAIAGSIPPNSTLIFQIRLDNLF